MTKSAQQPRNIIPLLRMPPRHAENLDWMEDARCVGMDPELFFPRKPKGAKPRNRRTDAQIIIENACNHCWVADQCLRYGRTIRATRGVWGGVDFGAHRKDDDDDE